MAVPPAVKPAVTDTMVPAPCPSSRQVMAACYRSTDRETAAILRICGNCGHLQACMQFPTERVSEKMERELRFCLLARHMRERLCAVPCGTA